MSGALCFAELAQLSYLKIGLRNGRAWRQTGWGWNWRLRRDARL